MKYIKLFTLTILMFCFTLQLAGQSRNPKPNSNLTIISQSEKLRLATGWKLDAMGNWISNENAISDTKLNESTQYTVPQNFKWIQLISLKNGTQDLYALLYETTLYISNTQSERRVYYYLMTSKSYASIAATVAKKSGETLTIHSSSYGYMSDKDGIYSASKLVQMMEQSILSTEENAPLYDLNINAQHVDNEDVVRFLLPEKQNNTSKTLANNYFETSWDNFNKILLPAPKQVTNEEFDLGNIAATATSSKQQIQQKAIENKNDSTRAEIEESDFAPNRSTTADETQTAIINGNDSITAAIVNKEKATISEPIASFSDIEGWYLNGENKWVADGDYTYRFETIGRYEMRNFRYHEKDYILIIRFEKYAGETFFLISKQDYLDAFSDLENTSIIRFPLVAYADLSNTLNDMIKISEQAIDTPKRKDPIIFKSNYLVLQYKLSSSKNLARFFTFQQECSKYGSETSKENCNAKVSSKIKDEDQPLLGSDVLFSKMYYESTYNAFIDFFQQPIVSSSKSNNDDGLAPR